MRALKNKELHVFISLFLFVGCLATPGIYVTATYNPNYGLALFLIGWLGILQGHVYWLANALYAAAIVLYTARKISLALSFIAICLVLSFLDASHLYFSYRHEGASAVTVGPGYLLWLLAIGVLFIGQVFKIPKRIGGELFCQVAFIIIASSFYIDHHFSGVRSVYYVQQEKIKYFERYCKDSKEEIHEKVSGVQGLYMEYNYHMIFNVDDGRVIKEISDSFTRRLFEAGTIGFYETPHTVRKKKEEEYYFPYERHLKNAKDPLLVDDLVSEYSVNINFVATPPRLGLSRYEIQIESLADSRVIAKTSYVYNERDRVYCGPLKDGMFSVADFISRVFPVAEKEKI